MYTKSSILTFGKHRGKSITDLLNAEEYSYIVWLHEKTSNVITENVYLFCKNKINSEKLLQEAIMDSSHGDYGCRD